MTRCDAYWTKVRELLSEDDKDALYDFCDKNPDTVALIVDHVRYVDDVVEKSNKPTFVGFAEKSKVAELSEFATRPLRRLQRQDPALHDEVLPEVLELDNPTAKKIKEIIETKRTDSMPPIPRGCLYYSDPPWEYDFSPTDSRKIENHYPTMSLEAIKSLEIPPGDAVLYLWATAPKLLEALEVMAAWGFEYKTHAIWDKMKLGMGYWFRGQHELLLVGTRGQFSPPAESLRISSIIRKERTAHSEKPDCIYRMLESQFPDIPKVEIFAREFREGWSSWGNEL